jgi:hypothetical protein
MKKMPSIQDSLNLHNLTLDRLSSIPAADMHKMQSKISLDFNPLDDSLKSPFIVGHQKFTGVKPPSPPADPKHFEKRVTSQV